MELLEWMCSNDLFCRLLQEKRKIKNKTPSDNVLLYPEDTHSNVKFSAFREYRKTGITPMLTPSAGQAYSWSAFLFHK